MSVKRLPFRMPPRSVLVSLAVLCTFVAGCSSGAKTEDRPSDDTPSESEQAETVDGYASQPARIYIDGDVGDWESLSVQHEDVGDGEELDIERLSVAHTNERLFLRVELGAPVNLQEDNTLTLHLDADGDPSTGASSFGTELRWAFGERQGEFEGAEVQHADVGLHSLPTVTSDVFEVALDRDATPDGETPLVQADSLRIAMSAEGDRLPDTGGLGYALTDASRSVEAPTIEPAASGVVRILSQNSVNDFDAERSAIFQSERQPSYQRIFRAVEPDVIAFQEVYAETAEETEQVAEGPLGLAQKWEWAKEGQDLVLGSRYPILDTHTIPGYDDYQSGAFLLDATDALGSRLVVITAHPPCCNYPADEDEPSRNVQRQQVVDGIVAFIRSVKNGDGPFGIEAELPIVIAGDMNFVGQAQQPRTLRTGEIVHTDEFGEAVAPDWDGSDLLDTNPRQTGAPMHATWASPGSSFPPGRLDYAYVTDSVLDVEHEFVLNTATLSDAVRGEYGLQPDDTATASDHMAVVVDVAAQ